MKNKEIEELLKYLKNKFYISGEFYTEEKIKALSKKELELLLSYIEQLENLCNKYEQEHKTTFEIWKKDIKKLKQLENNRDKAIEYIEMHSNALGVLDTIKNYTLLDILKGGSD